jgi:hypothetical protein
MSVKRSSSLSSQLSYALRNSSSRAGSATSHSQSCILGPFGKPSRRDNESIAECVGNRQRCSGTPHIEGRSLDQADLNGVSPTDGLTGHLRSTVFCQSALGKRCNAQYAGDLAQTRLSACRQWARSTYAGGLGRGKCPCNLKESLRRRRLRCRASGSLLTGLRREMGPSWPNLRSPCRRRRCSKLHRPSLAKSHTINRATETCRPYRLEPRQVPLFGLSAVPPSGLPIDKAVAHVRPQCDFHKQLGLACLLRQQIVEAARKGSSTLNERTVRTAFQRMKSAGDLLVEDNRWYVVNKQRGSEKATAGSRR